MSKTEGMTGDCDTGGDVDFAADVTDTNDWDNKASLEQTPLEQENEEVENGDAVGGDAEAVADDGEGQDEATGPTSLVETPDESAGESGINETTVPSGEGAEGEHATEENAVKSNSEVSYTCDMCKETFEETEEEHLKGRKHLKLLERLEKFGSLEAVAAEFQASVCYLCDVSAVSKSQMDMHIKGSKHRMRCANLKLPPSSLDLPGTNRTVQPAAKMETKSAGPPDPNAVLPERPVCDVCSITLSSVHQLVQHLSGKRHKEIVNALKQAVLRLPPNLRPPQLRAVLRKNDGKPPTGPAVKPAAPAPKPGNAVQGPVTKGVKRPAPPASGPATGPVKKQKQEQEQKPSQGAAASAASAGKTLFCDICNIKLNSEFQRTEHMKGRIHLERLAELKGEKAAGINKPGGPQQGSLLGSRPTVGKQVQKAKGQQQPKAAFWSNVSQRSVNPELQYGQRTASNRRENVAHVGRGLLHPASGKGGFGGPRHQGPNQNEFAPTSRQHLDVPHPQDMWQNLSAKPQWKSPVLPDPASYPSQRRPEPVPSGSFGLLDPPQAHDPREPGPFGLPPSTQQFSKLQLDLALEISKLSQHLARPEFSKELSQQLSHHISQELSRQRQMATDVSRPVREDFMPEERPPPLGERLPLLCDTLPLLEKLPLLRDQAPLLHDSYEDRAPRRPPLLAESAPGFDDWEQSYHYEAREERRPGIDSYGERRSRDYPDDYGSSRVRDQPPRESADYRRSTHSSSGGLLGRPPLLGSRY